MNFWAIVTARRNSKSILRKNITKIKNKELIKYSFDELKKVKELEKVIVSTDDEKIKKITEKYKFNYFKRKKKLSGDLVNSVDVVVDVLEEAKNKFNMLPSYFLLIQPTSIFLKKKHIVSLIKNLKTKKFLSAQTISKVPHQFHAYNQRHLDSKSKTFFVFQKERMKMHNKQTKPIFYSYGNLIATDAKKFLKKKNFFLKPSYGHVIERIYSFDLDNSHDLKVINQIIKKPIKSYE